MQKAKLSTDNYAADSEKIDPARVSTFQQSPGDSSNHLHSTHGWSGTEEGHGQTIASANHRLQIFGDYAIEALIARGGMGAVYKAKHRTLGRTVALKVIRSEGLSSSQAIERFKTEAIAAAGLEHSGIVPLYESGVIDGQPFIAMAYVEGESLANRIRERPLAPRQAARIIEIVTQAVAHAHQRGVIHRDIKPQNILLTTANDPVLTDFGLAKQTASVEESLTMDGQVLGTPSYMPPEQASGSKETVGPACDIYSLGATLYCALTGKPPFLASTIAEILTQVIQHEPTPPRQLNSSIPKDLETICLKCLDKNPKRRYATALELSADLERFRTNKPITAKRATLIDHTIKWTVRKPVAATIICMSLFAAIAAPIYYFSQPAYLTIHVEPKSANVFVNGSTVPNVDGMAVFKAPPARYIVEAKQPGYSSVKKEVQMIRGKSNAVYEMIVLESLSGYLRHISDPVGATVKVIDHTGKEVDAGLTPYNSKLLPTGTYKITVSKPLYKTYASRGEVLTGGRVAEIPTKKLEPAYEYSASYDGFLKRLSLLERPIKREWQFNNVPLAKFLSSVSKSEEIEFYVDSALLSSKSIDVNVPIAIALKDRSLHVALQSVLTPKKLELKPSLENDKLYIAVVPINSKEALETVVFPVELLVEWQTNRGPKPSATIIGIDYSELIDGIEQAVNSDSWSSRGGRATIDVNVQAKSLVIRQTWSALVEVEHYLRSLKEAVVARQSN